MKGLMGICKNGKHRPRHIGFFEVLDNVGPVLYRLHFHQVIYIPSTVPCLNDTTGWGVHYQVRLNSAIQGTTIWRRVNWFNLFWCPKVENIGNQIGKGLIETSYICVSYMTNQGEPTGQT